MSRCASPLGSRITGMTGRLSRWLPLSNLVHRWKPTYTLSISRSSSSFQAQSRSAIFNHRKEAIGILTTRGGMLSRKSDWHNFSKVNWTRVAAHYGVTAASLVGSPQGIASPRLPRIRTCEFIASGSSVHGLATYGGNARLRELIAQQQLAGVLLSWRRNTRSDFSEGVFPMREFEATGSIDVHAHYLLPG